MAPRLREGQATEKDGEVLVAEKITTLKRCAQGRSIRIAVPSTLTR